jgi:hypothetical protein
MTLRRGGPYLQRARPGAATDTGGELRSAHRTFDFGRGSGFQLFHSVQVDPPRHNPASLVMAGPTPRTPAIAVRLIGGNSVGSFASPGGRCGREKEYAQPWCNG